MKEKEKSEEEEDGKKELYALLHLSPSASDEEIRKAYRQWAQVYHPDKYQQPHMKDIATENFQRICEAYEILSDPAKRQIYDLYGMEGLHCGLELGPHLRKAHDLREELDRLKRRKDHDKLSSHLKPSGTILASLSVPHFLHGDGLMRGMGMRSEVESHISKRNTLAIAANLQVNGMAGGGAATAVLRHQMSSVSSVEFMASAGLHSLIGIQSTRFRSFALPIPLSFLYLDIIHVLFTSLVQPPYSTLDRHDGTRYVFKRRFPKSHQYLDASAVS